MRPESNMVSFAIERPFQALLILAISMSPFLILLAGDLTRLGVAR